MKTTFTLCISILFFLAETNAQNPLLKQWDFSYGGYDGDFIYTIVSAPDGGFLAAGNSQSNAMFEKSEDNWDGAMYPTYDCWLIKCDENGVKQWDKTLGGSDDDFFFNVISTSDSGYLMLASTRSPGDGNISQDAIGVFDMWLVKLNSAGEIEWEHRYGGDGNNGPGSTVQLSDGGYLVGGYTDALAGGDVSDDGYGSYDFWVLRLDASGNKIWDKKYGGSDVESVSCVLKTDDGGFLIGGGSTSGISGTKTVDNYINGQSDMWFLRIDSSGNYLWDRVLGSLDDDYAMDMFSTNDDHYVITVSTNAGVGGDKTEPTHGVSDFWMMKTDTQMNSIWDHSIGGSSNEDDFGNISLTNDGNYLLAGTSYSDPNEWKSESNNGPENTWILLLDTGGNRIWDKTILTGYTHTEMGLGIQLHDGCYLFANDGEGFTDQEKTDMSYSFDYWCIKYCDTSSIVDPPVSNVNFMASDTDICQKFCVSFFDSSTNDPIAWQWILPGGDPEISFEQNPQQICYDVPGVYDVTLITTSADGNDTLTLPGYITAYATPDIPTIEQTGNVLASSGAFSYQWQYNTQDIPGATNQSCEATQSGLYSIVVTNENGCVASSSIEVLFDAIEGNNVTKSLSIYPNPSTGIYYVTLDLSTVEPVIISVYNSLGKEIYRSMWTTSYNTIQKILDLSTMPAGAYMVNVQYSDQVMQSEILKVE